MKAVVSGVCAAAALVVLAAGCSAPRLASLPLTEEQTEWTSFVRASYPGWKPPYYSPVVTHTPGLPPAGALPAAPAGEVESVPAEPAR